DAALCVLRGEVPAIRVVNQRGLADQVNGGNGCTVGIQRGSESSTAVDGERMTAVVGVDAGGAEAAEDGAQHSVVGEALALAERKLVDVVGRKAMRDVEVAEAVPGGVVS